MRPKGPFGEGCRRSKGVPLAHFPRQRGSKYTYNRKTFNHRALLLPFYVVFISSNASVLEYRSTIEIDSMLDQN